MNNTTEPITNPGLTWAWNKIMDQLEKAAQQKPKQEVLENPEPHKASSTCETQNNR